MTASARAALLALGAAAMLAAVMLAHGTEAAARQAWPPFVLVGGLLAVGFVAAGDGVFEAAADRLVRLPGPPVALLLACYGLVALVTAVLNLDTSVVFLTPVLIGVARRRCLEVAPFLYGSVFMANASSLYLPGSNLTNLLVLAQEHVSGATFAARMLVAALTATVATAVVLVAIHRRALARVTLPRTGEGAVLRGRRDAVAGATNPSGERPVLGLAGALVSATLIVALPNAALAVLGVGVAMVAWRARQGRLGIRRALAHVNLPVLAGLFGLAVGLGAVARSWSYPAHVMQTAGRWPTLAIAALSSVLINNLPAAVLLGSSAPAHPRALLIGLNLGPNLAVTGALSALLWMQSAQASGVSPSLSGFSRQGVVLAPLTLLASLAVAQLVGSTPL